MGKFRIYDGTNWVDPCLCPVRVLDAAGVWQIIDPNNCDVNYFDGLTWCPIECDAQPIDANTEINIWFDNSGSMNATLPGLNEMRDNFLQACLVPVYNNDLALYQERVKVINFTSVVVDGVNGNERSIALLGSPRNLQRSVDTSVDQVVNLTFQDESSPYGTGNPSSIFDPNTTQQFQDTQGRYNSDIIYTRNNIATEPYTIKGCAFVVRSNNGAFQAFQDQIRATFIDEGAFTPPFNLRDLVGTNFTYRLDTTASSTGQYYLDQVVAALNELGVLVNCTP
jgi:hypothetical protein